MIIEDLQQKLHAVRQKFDILEKATNDAIRDWDLRSNQMVWNHGLKTIFGYNEDQFSHGYDVWVDNIHTQDKEDVLQAIKTALDTGSPNWNAIYRYKCINGSFKYTYDRGYIVYENKVAVRMIGSMQDIDERMNALAEIEKLSLVASNTENLVIITDAEEKIEWVNDGFVNSTGYHLHEVVGKTPRFLQGPETDRTTLDRIKIKIQANESITEEVLNYTKDGTKIWLRLTINPVFDNANNLIRMVAVETDITQQKQYENKITTIARELSDLIQNANAVIFGVDQDGFVNEWNKQAIVATGYSKAEAIGKQLTDFVTGSGRRVIVERLIKYVLDGNLLSLREFQITNRDGGNDILLLSATPRRNASGEIIGVIAVGQDITELTQYRQSLEEKVKERTQALQLSLEKEKELVELKSKFISVASHEFRTPLSTISLVGGILKKHRDKLSSEEFDGKLEAIEKQVRHMTYLLDDILMIGKGDAGKIQLNFAPLSIVEFFTHTAAEVAEGSDRQTFSVKFNCSIGEISTDEKLLRRIYTNLLVNARKFSTDTVEVSVSNNSDHLIFNVVDKGIGINETDKETIFTPFHRGSNVGAIQGTGLGLSIVKKAVDMLKGEIVVHSKINVGTVFTVSIPLAGQAPA